MKHLFLILFGCWNILSVQSQTLINSGLVSGVWTKNASPYLINGSIEIPSGNTLVIESGVEVVFQGYYKINVQGRILAEGLVSDSIYFYPVNTTTGWKGIRFLQTPNSNDSSKFEFCSIKYGKSSGAWPDDNGGAFCLYDFSKVKLAHCRIENNEAGDGGAIFNYNAAPLVTNCVIRYNKANWNGGAIIGPGRYLNNVIAYNQGVNCGGLYFFGSDTVANNLICNNRSQNFGGGVFCGGGLFTNNIIANNEANNGGGVHFYPGNVTFLNNTITNNKATLGGAFDMEQAAKPNLINCILWGNTATTGSQVNIAGEGEDPNFYNCDIEGGSANFATNGYIYTGIYQNNLDVNPLFLNPSLGSGILFDATTSDWSLSSSSPCIDYGIDNESSIKSDINGNSRLSVCKYDLGAIEFQKGNPLSSNIILNQAITCHNGSNAEITVQTTGGNGVYNYTWNTGHIGSTLTNLSAGKYLVVITETGENCTLKDSITIANPNPLKIDIGAANQNIVCDATIQLSVTDKWDTLNFTPYQTNYESIQFIDDSVGYAVGGNGKIYKTIDKGDNWTSLNTSPFSSIYDVYFFSTIEGIIIGSDNVGGVIYKTTDGGITWSQKYTGMYTLWSLDGNSNQGLFVVGTNGTVIHSTDQGETWNTFNTNSTANLNDIHLMNGTNVFVVGENGTLLYSNTNGSSWSPIQHPYSSGTVVFNTIFFSDSNNGLIGGNNGLLLRTIDGGQHWFNSSISSNGHIYDIYKDQSNQLYIAGYNILRKSSNYGKSWTDLYSWNHNLSFPKIVGFYNGNLYLITNDMDNAANYILKKSPILYSNVLWTPSIGLSDIHSQNPNLNGVSSQTYVVQVSDNLGCSALDSIHVSVSPITIDLGQSVMLHCGMDTTLSVQTNTYTGDGILSYNWTPLTGLDLSNSSNPQANPNQSTWYQLTIHSPLGCTATDSVFVYVQPITLDVGNDLHGVCGDSVYVQNVFENSGGLGNPTYSWLPTTGVAHPTEMLTGIAPISTSTYILTLTTDNGCIAKDSLVILIDTLVINASIDQTITCGSNIELSIVSHNYQGIGNLTYQWSPSQFLSDTTIQNPIANPISTQIYQVQASSPTGCIAYDEVVVNINPFTIFIGSDSTITCGESIQLGVIETNYSGNGQLSYIWSPSTHLNDAQSPQPLFYSSQNEEINVSVLTDNGCLAYDTMQIFVQNLNVSYDDVQQSCGESTPVNFTTNYHGNDPLMFIWNTQNGLSDSTIANPIISTLQNTNFSVSVTTLNGCTDSDTLHVSFIQKDAPSICLVGVNENFNEVMWNKTQYPYIDSFFVFRETNQTNQYELIKKLAYDDYSLFIDSNSAPQAQSNKYKLSMKDVCGLETNLSEAHKTMHLTINQGVGDTWNLIWEPYEGNPVNTYNIYRGTNASDLQLIGTSSASNTQYTDLNAPSGFVYYQVELQFQGPCLPEKNFQSSFSNIATNNPASVFATSIDNTAISVYPNPFHQEIEIVNPTFKQNYELFLFTADGKFIRQFNIEQSVERISMTDLSPGLYLLKDKTGAIVKLTKLQ